SGVALTGTSLRNQNSAIRPPLSSSSWIDCSLINFRKGSFSSLGAGALTTLMDCFPSATPTAVTANDTATSQAQVRSMVQLQKREPDAPARASVTLAGASGSSYELPRLLDRKRPHIGPTPVRVAPRLAEVAARVGVLDRGGGRHLHVLGQRRV